MQELIFGASAFQVEQSHKAANVAQQPERPEAQGDTFAKTVDGTKAQTRERSDGQEPFVQVKDEQETGKKSAEPRIKEGFIFQSRVVQARPVLGGGAEPQAQTDHAVDVIDIEAPETDIDAQIEPRLTPSNVDETALWRSRRAENTELLQMMNDSSAAAEEISIHETEAEAGDEGSIAVDATDEVPVEQVQSLELPDAAKIEEAQETDLQTETQSSAVQIDTVQIDERILDRPDEFAAQQKPSGPASAMGPLLGQAFQGSGGSGGALQTTANTTETASEADFPDRPVEPRLSSNGAGTAEKAGSVEVKATATPATQNYAAEWQFVSQRDTAMAQADPLLGIADGAELARNSVQPLGVTPTVTATPQIAQNAVAQIVVAVDQAKANNFEIVLDPEELGTVRILMSPKDGGYDITVIASREQTLDMMRKYASDLQNSFAGLGYSETTLDFQSSDDSEPGFGRGDGGNHAEPGAEVGAHEPQQVVTLGGLDLRL